MVEAHHADPFGAKGARHSGNLLILSRVEHHRCGGVLSRAQITEALKNAKPRTLRFGKRSKAKNVAGVVAKVSVPSTGEVIPIFFTQEHRAHWLQEAGEEV